MSSRAPRDEWLDDEEERRIHLAAFAAQRVGEPLLRPEGPEDHEARIFAAARDPELWRLSAIGLRWTVGAGFAAATERGLRPALADVFGRGAIRCLETGDALAVLIADALVQRWRHVGGTHVWVRHEDLLQFLCDPAMPSEIAGAAARAAEGAACFTAMALAVIARRDVRPVIAAKLAERWVSGQCSLLRLLASMPGVDVPLMIVPTAQQFDLEALFADAAAKASAEPAAPLPT